MRLFLKEFLFTEENINLIRNKTCRNIPIYTIQSLLEYFLNMEYFNTYKNKVLNKEGEFKNNDINSINPDSILNKLQKPNIIDSPLDLAIKINKHTIMKILFDTKTDLKYINSMKKYDHKNILYPEMSDPNLLFPEKSKGCINTGEEVIPSNESFF